MFGMRDVRSLLLALPFVLGGTLAGHEAGYRLTTDGAHAREHALAASGHGYMSFAPVVLGAATAFAILGFLLIVRIGAHGRRTRIAPWALAAFAPLAFAAQEHLERYVTHGEFPWGAALEPSFLVGLAFQLPFALAALALARWLGRVALDLGRALGAPPLARLDLFRALAPASVLPLPAAAIARGASERGPPLR
jgi:hypothetical protein